MSASTLLTKRSLEAVAVAAVSVVPHVVAAEGAVVPLAVAAAAVVLVAVLVVPEAEVVPALLERKPPSTRR